MTDRMTRCSLRAAGRGAAALALFLIALAPRPAAAQPAPRVDARLQAALERLAEAFRGDVGVYVRHLPTGRTAALRPDERFPAASMIKVPILVKTFDLIERGVWDYDRELAVRSDSIGYPHSPWEFSAAMTPDRPVALNKLVMLMLTLSENNASLWLQEHVGGGAAVNAWLAANGFDHTRVNARTEGREAAYEAYGWGQTTPREMAELLVTIREGRAVSPAASAAMYRALTRSFWDGEALSAIPPTVQAASKQGAVSASRSEVVLVNAPHGDYVFCVVTAGQEDRSWDDDNEGFVLIRDVARLLWRHFEPDAAWEPPPGAARYR